MLPWESKGFSVVVLQLCNRSLSGHLDATGHLMLPIVIESWFLLGLNVKDQTISLHKKVLSSPSHWSPPRQFFLFKSPSSQSLPGCILKYDFFPNKFLNKVFKALSTMMIIWLHNYLLYLINPGKFKINSVWIHISEPEEEVWIDNVVLFPSCSRMWGYG